MQTSLKLDDKPLRPRIYSTAVIMEAAKAYAESKSLHQQLNDCEEADETWIRDCFLDAARWATNDAWDMASHFAKKIDGTVGEDMVEMFENFLHHLSKHQDRIIREWVADNAIADPVPDAARASVSGVTGIAFHEERYATKGQCTFFQDEDRRDRITPQGSIMRFMIVEWERLENVCDLTEDDAEIVRRHREAERRLDEEASQHRLRSAAKAKAEAILKSHQVTDEEAEAIFARFAFPDLKEAARAANAILSMLPKSFMVHNDT